MAYEFHAFKQECSWIGCKYPRFIWSMCLPWQREAIKVNYDYFFRRVLLSCKITHWYQTTDACHWRPTPNYKISISFEEENIIIYLTFICYYVGNYHILLSTVYRNIYPVLVIRGHTMNNTRDVNNTDAKTF